jgi:hypothetical protein
MDGEMEGERMEGWMGEWIGKDKGLKGCGKMRTLVLARMWLDNH